MKETTTYCDFCGGWVDREKEKRIEDIVVAAEHREITIDPLPMSRPHLAEREPGPGKDDFRDAADHHLSCYLAALSHAALFLDGTVDEHFAVKCPEDGHTEILAMQDISVGVTK